MPVTADPVAPLERGGADGAVQALVCDWAGVLTNPFAEILGAWCRTTGFSAECVGGALAATARRYGADPFAELERGRLTEAQFLVRIGAALSAEAGRPADLSDFRGAWFAGIRPNRAFLAYLAGLHTRGLTLAVLTNNVGEWSPLWRATLPDGLFEHALSSADEGVRKPEPEIYERMLERLALPPSTCLFVDDVEPNCEAARACGMEAIRFHSTSQAISDIERRLLA